MNIGTLPPNDRAARLLERVLAHRLTVVSAGSGWGKSTLLTAFAQLHPTIEIDGAIDGGSPYALATALASGFGARLADFHLELPRPPGVDRPVATQDDALAGVLAEALGAVRRERRDWIVAIDDFPTDPDHSCSAFLGALARQLPRHIHLVVAADVSLSTREIGELRGDLLVLRHDVLALTDADLDPDVAPPAVRERILTATAGWPVAVRMALEEIAAIDRDDDTAHGEGTTVDAWLAGTGGTLLGDLVRRSVARLDADALGCLRAITAMPYLSESVLVRLGRSGDLPALRRLVAEGVLVQPCAGRRDAWQLVPISRPIVERIVEPGVPPELAVTALLSVGDAAHALTAAVRAGDAKLVLQTIESEPHWDRLGGAETVGRAIELVRAAGGDPIVDELAGDIAAMTGDWDGAIEKYERCRAADGRVRPLRKAVVLRYLRGQLDEVIAIVDSGYDTDEAPGESALLLAWVAAAHWLRGDLERCGDILTTAESIVPADDDAALAAIHTGRAMLAAMHADRRGNDYHYERALRHASRAGDALQLVRIRTNRGSHLLEEGAFDDAVVELDQAIDLAQATGLDAFAALALANRGQTRRQQGRLDEAQSDLREAQRIWQRSGSALAGYARGHLGFVHLDRGDLGQAEGAFDEARRLAEHRGDLQGLVPPLIGLAQLALRRGEPDVAAELADRARGVGPTLAHAQATVVAAEARRALGDPKCAMLARQALDEARRQRDRNVIAEALLAVASADPEPDLGMIHEAIDLAREIGSPIAEAHALMRLAEFADVSARVAAAERAAELYGEAGAFALSADATRLVERQPDARVRIATLGGLTVFRDGVEVSTSDWGSRKTRELLKHLVAHRGRVSRVALGATLWPDEDDPARRLSALVSTLRAVLDPEKAEAPDHFVGADPESVWLDTDDVEVDIERFETLTGRARELRRAGRPLDAASMFAAAQRLYLGEFLADDTFVDEFIPLREHLRLAASEVARSLARSSGDAGDHGAAARQWLRALELDPYDESAHLGLIGSLVARRSHGEARRAYRAYVGRMAELGIEPEPFPD